MHCPERLSQWIQEVSRAFEQLSIPQARGLALWSAGIALGGSAGITQISALLALVLDTSEQSVFQRLREWYLDAKQKRGKKRQELKVSTCFAPLLSWIIRLWESERQQMVLVMDATSLGQRWTVLSVCVALRGCAIPVAWKVVGAHEKGSWRPYWEEFLALLAGAIPSDWQVLVLADRGLYARWLYQAIVDKGWHPFMRLNLAVKARAEQEQDVDWISRWTPKEGMRWKGRVECFVNKASRVKGTLLMEWQAGYEHPWVVLTDLQPQEAQISWYGMRSWVEAGYKDFKRGQWGWHHSKMRQASGVERLWLAMALAQLWTMSVGTQAEARQEQNVNSVVLPAKHIATQRRQRPAGQPAPRRLSCVVRGRLQLLALLFSDQRWPVGQLVPQAWPESISSPRKLPSAQQLHQRERRRASKRRAKARASARR